MPVVDWNAQTERSVNRGLSVLPSNTHSGAGLGETVSSSLTTTGANLQESIKRVLMEKAALTTGVSVAMTTLALSVPIVGQIVAAVYGLVQALFSSKYKAELQAHLDAFDQWSKKQGEASDKRLTQIQNDAWLKIRTKAIAVYSESKAKGINSTAALARVSPWWQDLVAKYSKPASAAPATGVGELFPIGLSGLAWVGDDEMVYDRIQSPGYTGLAHVLDTHGNYYGSVWYDGRLLYPRNGLGDFWSNLKDTVSGTYRKISSKVVALVPKVANFIPPVAAIKYIAVPVMKEVGWEGTATKLENGVTAAGQVVAAGAIAAAATAVLGPVAAFQGAALVGGRVVALGKQPTVALLSATGHDTVAKQAGNLMDKTADKGDQYAGDPSVAVKDVHTVVDTLTGKESVNQADEQIAKGKKTLLAALAQRESEAKTQLNSEVYQTTTAGMLVCKMLDDPQFAAQLLQMAGQEQAQAKSSAGIALAAAAAAGGLFLMHR